MSQSLLYHAFGVRDGYDYVETLYQDGCVRFVLSVRPDWIKYPACGGKDIVRKGRRFRELQTVPITVQGFEERAERLELDITDAHKRVKELGEKVGAKFEREDRFQELTRRQSEIEEKLDLTKNQAPSQVEAVSAGDEEQKISENQTQTHSPRRTRGAAVHV